MNEIITQVKKIFSEKFQGDPGIYFSPGRINLIGEHVDYNDGFVMPAAINKGLYYAIRPNVTDTANFYSVDFNESHSTKLDAVESQTGWKNYVLSVLNEFLLADKNIGGFDCVLAGDIPRGSGMSSSAAVEGGLAFALNEIFNAGFDRKDLALLCQRAEHNFPNVKCGIMDQFANMFGKKDQVMLLDCRSIEHNYFPLQLEGYEIMLVNSKVHHSLASSEYNQRRLQCEEGLAVMKANDGISSFRQVDGSFSMQKYKALLPDAVYDCCAYVVDEIERTQKAAKYLQENDLFNFGKLMYQTHWGLSNQYKVSCKELDFLVEFAQKNEAVIGSRLMGGGFGGCTINLVKKDLSAIFSEEITTAYKNTFGIEAEIYRVQTSDGTHRIM